MNHEVTEQIFALDKAVQNRVARQVHIGGYFAPDKNAPKKWAELISTWLREDGCIDASADIMRRPETLQEYAQWVAKAAALRCLPSQTPVDLIKDLPSYLTGDDEHKYWTCVAIAHALHKPDCDGSCVDAH